MIPHTTPLTDAQLAEWAEVCVDMSALHAAADFLTVRASNARALNPDGFSVDYYTNGATALRAFPLVLAELRRVREAVKTMADAMGCEDPTDLAGVTQNFIGLMGALRLFDDEVPELRKDAARLAWLEQQARDAYANPQEITDLDIGIASADFSDCTKGVSVVISHGYADETIGETLRSAVDTAMAKEAAHV